MHPVANNESGIWALQLLLRLRGDTTTAEELRRRSGQGAAGAEEIVQCARASGLAARAETTTWDGLAALPLPGIAILRDGRFILLGAVNHEKAVILASGAERPAVIMRDEFEALWSGRLIWLKHSSPGAIDKLLQRFDTNLVPRARNALIPATRRAAHLTRKAAVNLVARLRDFRHPVTAPIDHDDSGPTIGFLAKIMNVIDSHNSERDAGGKPLRTFPRPALPDDKRRRSDERAFLPAALEIVETPPSPLGRTIAFSIMAVFGVALTWACIGTVDIVAIAPGKIIPSGRTKTIQPLETGVVRAIHVHDGQSVKSGDILIELDTTAVNAELEHLRGNLMATRLEIARLEAALASKDDPLLAFTPPQDAPADLIAIHRGLLVSQTSEQKAKLAAVESQLAQKVAERDTIQASVDKLKATITPLQQRVEIREQLFQKELGSKLTYLTELQDLVSQRHDILVQTSRNSETDAAISGLMETRTKIVAEYERSLFDALTKAKKTAAGLGQDIIKTDRRRNLQMLTAPVDGIVQQLAVHTIGGIVTPAQALMLVVPAESRLEIEAMVSNRDIGFVAAGQHAAIKVDTFNFTRYGLLNGTILAVSQDAIARDRPAAKAGENAPGSEGASSEPRGQELLYSARISVDRTQLQIDDKRVNLSPGMAVTAEIKTGSRRIISYLMSPLARYQHESLRER